MNAAKSGYSKGILKMRFVLVTVKNFKRHKTDHLYLVEVSLGSQGHINQFVTELHKACVSLPRATKMSPVEINTIVCKNYNAQSVQRSNESHGESLIRIPCTFNTFR